MKHAETLALIAGLIAATPVNVSRRYSGPTQQDIDQARSRGKKKQVREEIRARKARNKS